MAIEIVDRALRGLRAHPIAGTAENLELINMNVKIVLKRVRKGLFEMPDSSITLKQAVDRLREELIADQDYRAGWVANIAIAFQDECKLSFVTEAVTPGAIHYVANQAARRFIDSLKAAGSVLRDKDFGILAPNS